MKYRFIYAIAAVLIAAAFIVFIGQAQIEGSAKTLNAEPRPTPVKKMVKAQPAKAAPNMLVLENREFDGDTVVKTDDEWSKLLTADQFYILRKAGTERAYTGALTDNHEHGVYYCAACGLALFSSEAKYNSETGWPSFFQPIFKKNVIEKIDNSLEETRTEVLCSRCGGHLGHVFDDGPEPTGLRYCMNSAALVFKKQ